MDFNIFKCLKISKLKLHIYLNCNGMENYIYIYINLSGKNDICPYV